MPACPAPPSCSHRLRRSPAGPAGCRLPACEGQASRRDLDPAVKLPQLQPQGLKAEASIVGRLRRHCSAPSSCSRRARRGSHHAPPGPHPDKRPGSTRPPVSSDPCVSLWRTSSALHTVSCTACLKPLKSKSNRLISLGTTLLIVGIRNKLLLSCLGGLWVCLGPCLHVWILIEIPIPRGHGAELSLTCSFRF